MVSFRSRIVLSCWILVLFAAAGSKAQPLPLASPESVGISPERLQVLTEVMQDYVETEKLPGTVLLVLKDGKTAYFETFGALDRESGLPMPEDAIFRIASQSKALISVGVMMLQEQGKLLITDRAGDYLPEFRKTSVAVPVEGGGYEVVEAKRPIAIRDLLTHTAGIGYGEGVAGDRWKAAGIQGWYFAERDEPIGATVARMAALPFDAQPGEQWVYGYNIDILGALIERVSGLPLDEYLRVNILEPLGMHDTHFYLPVEKVDRLAVVYSMNDDGKLERAPEPGGMVGQGAYVEGPRKCFSGGAGLLSTASDYARFLQMLLNGGELDGKRILSPKSVQLMTVDHLDGIPFRDGQGFGLGFWVRKDIGAAGVPGSIGEYGWGGAYHSQYWVDPIEKLVVVHMTQFIPTGSLNDHDRVRTLIYGSLMEAEAYP